MHRTEVTEATEGGIRGKPLALVDTGTAGREPQNWECIAQRSRRPQRGELAGNRWRWWTPRLQGENHKLGMHRTEVTEAMEGGITGKPLALMDTATAGREPQIGNASHRGHGGHGGGIRGKPLALVDTATAGREPQIGKASHKGHGGHGGGNKREVAGVGGHRDCRARTTNWESIAQRSRRPQRGE